MYKDLEGYWRRDWKYDLIAPTVFIFILFTIVIVHTVVEYNNPERIRAQADLKREFSLTHPPPGDVPLHESYSPKIERRAMTGDKFKSELNAMQLMLYYDRELTSKGWRIASERPPHGTIIRTYKKGEYTATLEYDTSDQNSVFNYSLTFTWGLDE